MDNLHNFKKGFWNEEAYLTYFYGENWYGCGRGMMQERGGGDATKFASADAGPSVRLASDNSPIIITYCE